MDKNGKLQVEGIITFKSGKTKNTTFIFENATLTSKGNLKFVGKNESFSNKNAFTLNCSLNKCKLITESIDYNYFGKDSKTNSIKRIKGTIKR